MSVLLTDYHVWWAFLIAIDGKNKSTLLSFVDVHICLCVESQLCNLRCIALPRIRTHRIALTMYNLKKKFLDADVVMRDHSASGALWWTETNEIQVLFFRHLYEYYLMSLLTVLMLAAILQILYIHNEQE